MLLCLCDRKWALLQHLQGCLALLVGQHGVTVAAGQALAQRAVAGAAVGFGRAQLIGPDYSPLGRQPWSSGPCGGEEGLAKAGRLGGGEGRQA